MPTSMTPDLREPFVIFDTDGGGLWNCMCLVLLEICLLTEGLATGPREVSSVDELLSIFGTSLTNILTLFSGSFPLALCSSEGLVCRLGSLSNSRPCLRIASSSLCCRLPKIIFLIPHPLTTRPRYCRHGFAVPKTAYVTSQAVTPGMKSRISTIAP
jgi:hypothetical protein